ncbi:MAG: response regulator, partial [Acidobacteria bacterium]|nr:response regulator [Acidobacteriota bacterium]
MSLDPLLLLLAALLAGGVALALSTWVFRRQSAAQQRQLGSFYSVVENMISASDPAEIYRRMVRAVPPMLDATHCYLLLHNRISRQLDVLAGTDKFPASTLPMDVVSGPVTCCQNKVPLEVPDAESCPFVDQVMVRRLRQRSLLFVPMMSEGEVFGVLQIDDRRRKRGFTEEQKASAQHIANLGALAMKLCEQRSMREQLYRTEKMAAVGELITGVAHELKSPLSSLSGLSELALVRYGSEPLADDLRAIHAEAKHASSILQRLISFARPQKPVPAAVDLHGVLRAAMAIREDPWQAKGIRVHLQLSSTPPMVVGDPSQLEQVFLNLLINAEQAMEESKERLITVGTAIVAKRVLISISDTGTGLSRDRQNPNYALFFDNRRAGETAGLGLTLCQSLIEGLGGTIRVSNRSGQATTFEIEYPLVELAARIPARAAAQSETEARRPSGFTALVIDEDRKVQDSLLNLLSDRKYRVITVSSAEEALDLTERARFDLVLCDVRLRGVSAIELYRRIRHRIRSFVFLTGENFSGDLREMFSEPNKAVLAKPFTAADVEHLLDEIEPGL